MAVNLREKNWNRWLLIAAALALAGCAAPRPRPEPAALEARAVLPPHVIEVAEGLFTCERGYLIRQGRCISFAHMPLGPTMEISSLPSAGDGAAGGRLCPSGGCGSYATPSYSTFVYSGLGQYGYYGAGWPWLSDGRICAPRPRRFRGGELAFGGRFGSFVQERRFASGGFFGVPLRHSTRERRSQASGRFGGNRTSRWR